MFRFARRYPTAIRMMAALAVIVATSAVGFDADATYPITVASPDGRLKIAVDAPTPDDPGALCRFDVSADGVPLLEACKLGLEVANDADAFRDLRLQDIERDTIDETYRLPGAKSNPIRSHSHQATLHLQGPGSLGRRVELQVRAYDDGVALRYLIPAQPGLNRLALTDERTVFRPHGNPTTWPLFHRNFITNHEANYQTLPLDHLPEHRDLLIDLPLLMQWKDGTGVALTEARLRNYAGAFLKARGVSGRTELYTRLSPVPEQHGPKVVTQLPLVSPWRVIMVDNPPGRLIESNLLLNLNDPCAIGDTSWIKFGKTTWHWWNGTAQEPVGFTTGLDYATMAHYIDFCAENGIPFHALVFSIDDFPWYIQSKPGVAPTDDTNVLAARPELEMERLLQYAKRKGVDIRLWVHWQTIYGRLEEVFSQYEKWGIAGLMVDFLDRDDQEMVRFCEEVLKAAARHHLKIQFHGVGKPTGFRRTYPNLVNHEGVLNLEYLKWSAHCTPDHDVIVAYTRMLAGPMDYHLGGFHSVTPTQFKPQNQNPMVLGTRCHQLAMYVIYENPVPMVCDTPTAYRGQPGFDFLKQVPTCWDETRFLLGEPGQYIAVARRSGDDWYIGCMTGHTLRNLEIPLSFLPEGDFDAYIWSDDASQPDDPNRLQETHRRVTRQIQLPTTLLPGGGQVIRLVPVDRNTKELGEDTITVISIERLPANDSKSGLFEIVSTDIKNVGLKDLAEALVKHRRDNPREQYEVYTEYKCANETSYRVMEAILMMAKQNWHQRESLRLGRARTACSLARPRPS